MPEELFAPVLQNPAIAAPPSAIGRLFELVLAFLNRFFGKKHPGNFDAEIGSWRLPDVNITDFTGNVPPRPLNNNSCSKHIYVYCYVFNRAAQCTFAGQMAALAQATGKVAEYIRDDYNCTNPNCLQEVGELVWFGFKCTRFAPTGDSAAVLVRFRCVPEL